jgi:hypothetical protein
MKLELITNQDLLQAIFGADAHRAHVTSFPDDPTKVPNTGADRSRCWGGWPHGARELSLENNNYYAVSLFGCDDEGRQRRRKAQFEEVCVLVADDVGDKISLESIERLPPPSIIIETSPGNFHYLYLVKRREWPWAEPLWTERQAAAVVDGWIAGGLTADGKDSGMAGVSRYARLLGLNTKAKWVDWPAAGFEVRVAKFEPEVRYGLEELAEPFGVDLDAVALGEAMGGGVDVSADIEGHPVLSVVSVTGHPEPGKYFVECPWKDGHTDGVDSGTTAIWLKEDGTAGFKCHHGHCEGHRLPELMAWCVQQDGWAAAEEEFRGTREAFEAVRRAEQNRENMRLGDEGTFVPQADQLNLPDTLGRFVFASEGKRVIDRMNPALEHVFCDWQALYKSSVLRTVGPRGGADETPITALWLGHAQRFTVVSRTFKAGAGEFVLDPEQRQCINSWQPIVRDEDDVIDEELLSVFLDHIKFLFPERGVRERFLDWIAHIEQKPGELPHTAWLHISAKTGLGRNWVASVLARTWRGQVSPNFNLISTLNTGFNDRLSGKILAIVDEIREGGGAGQWKHAETLKSMITEEHRAINPKCARMRVEFNACRFLMFSNHLSAIPINTNDRRIEVVTLDVPCRGRSYYKALYAALDDPRFIKSVAKWLGERDLRAFNPGAHAVWSEDKCDAAGASKSEYNEIAERIVQLWPNDLITATALQECLFEGALDGSSQLTGAPRHALEEAGIIKAQWRVNSGGLRATYYVLRNKEKWRKSGGGVRVRAELEANGAPVAPGSGFDGVSASSFLGALEEKYHAELEAMRESDA